jgi:alpha-L-fucosidase 2
VAYRDLTPERGTAPEADIYVPEGPGPHPSVVLVHGGGFVVGSRTMKPVVFLATRLVQAGFLVFVPSYRQVFRGGRLDQMVHDIEDALSWWLEHRTDYEGDPTHCALVAKSAGAPITLLATQKFPPGSFEHFVSIFGIYDLRPAPGFLGGLMSRLLLATKAGVPGDASDALSRSPLGGPPETSPLTLLHGTADRMVPYAQAQSFLARRKEQGAEVSLITYDGAEHSWFSDAALPVCQRSVDDILEALRKRV